MDMQELIIFIKSSIRNVKQPHFKATEKLQQSLRNYPNMAHVHHAYVFLLPKFIKQCKYIIFSLSSAGIVKQNSGCLQYSKGLFFNRLRVRQLAFIVIYTVFCSALNVKIITSKYQDALQNTTMMQFGKHGIMDSNNVHCKTKPYFLFEHTT